MEQAVAALHPCRNTLAEHHAAECKVEGDWLYPRFYGKVKACRSLAGDNVVSDLDQWFEDAVVVGIDEVFRAADREDARAGLAARRGREMTEVGEQAPEAVLG